MKKNHEDVVKCLLDSSVVCDSECTMFSQCWNEEEMNKKQKNEADI